MALTLHLVQLDIKPSYLGLEGTGSERMVRLWWPMACGCPSWWRRWWLKAHLGSCCIQGSLPRTCHCSRRWRQQRILIAFQDWRQVIKFWVWCRRWGIRTCKWCWRREVLRTRRWCWRWNLVSTCRWCWWHDILSTCRRCWRLNVSTCRWCWWRVLSTCRWWWLNVVSTCRWCWWRVVLSTCRWCWWLNVVSTCRWCWWRVVLSTCRWCWRLNVVIHRQCLTCIGDSHRGSRGRKRNLRYLQLDWRWWWWWQG